MRRAQARETGAVAIVVAVSATMIFGLCAIAVDLGAAVARRRDLQTQADLAALAAAAQLPHSPTNDPDIFSAANTFASENIVPGQESTTPNYSGVVDDNGFIQFVGKNKLRLFAPESTVDFWLSPAIGLGDGMNISAVAAAEIRSPGKGLPFFVSESCGWGAHTILDETSGAPADDYEPALAPTSSPASSAKIEHISPASVPLGATPGSVTMELTATTPNGFDGIDLVGFAIEGEPASAHITYEVTGAGDTLLVQVPDVVLTTEAIWWIRVHKGSSDRWSSSDNAQPFVVGNPGVDGVCNTKNSGNFGSLNLSRDEDVVSGWFLGENMALGIQHGLQIYEPLPFPADCAATGIMDSGEPEEGVDLNCLTTDSGADLQQSATRAFITGTRNGSPGRLRAAAHPTSAECESGSPARSDRTVDISGNPSTAEINDDLLSCFFLDSTVTVGAVSSESGAPSNVISEAIFDSPRFFWIPVLVADPTEGRAGNYAIVGFRPVFITGEADESRRDVPLMEDAGENGIKMAGGSIERIRVRSLNPVSLPDFMGDDGDNTVPYLGSGTEVVRLVE